MLFIWSSRTETSGKQLNKNENLWCFVSWLLLKLPALLGPTHGFRLSGSLLLRRSRAPRRYRVPRLYLHKAIRCLLALVVATTAQPQRKRAQIRILPGVESTAAVSIVVHSFHSDAATEGRRRLNGRGVECGKQSYL